MKLAVPIINAKKSLNIVSKLDGEPHKIRACHLGLESCLWIIYFHFFLCMSKSLALVGSDVNPTFCSLA